MKRISIERVLLILILILQVVLLIGLRRGGVGPQTRGGIEEAAVTRGAGTTEEGRRDELSGAAFADGTRQLMAVHRASLAHARRAFDGMDALFEQALADIDRRDSWFDVDDAWRSLLVSPMLDMREDADSYTVLFAMPGLSPSGVGVLLDGRVVTIQASYDSRLVHPHTAGPLTIERYVRLPGPIGDASDANASLTNGVLRIRLPKGVPENPLARGARLF